MFFLFAADGEDGAEPVSLYLDLEEGKVADMEVVAAAAIAFSISPVLLAGDRRWKFRSPYGDFGATIKDKEFLERVLAGRLEIPLAAGIELDVDLETTEERREEVWTPIERSVIKVHGVYPPPTQTDLLLPPG